MLDANQEKYLFKKVNYWDSRLARKKWGLSSAFEAANIAKAARTLKCFGWLCIILDGILVLIKTIVDAWNGKDWEYDLFSGIVEITLGLVI